ncbi:hypothetical protein ACWDPV_00900 [Gordonia sp. NPDC003504]
MTDVDFEADLQGFEDAQSRARRGFLGAAAILEALDIESLLFLPSLRMMLSPNAIWGDGAGPDAALAHQIRSSINRHTRAADVLGVMLRDAMLTRRDAESALRTASGALPVRAQRTLVDDAVALSDPRRADLLRLAFLLVATHALSDPTDCATASRSLNLVPPPLHRDRSMMNSVLSQIVPMLSASDVEGLGWAVGHAASIFAVPDEHRLPTAGAVELVHGTSDLTLVRLNPHSLHLACKLSGLPTPEPA